MSGVAALMRLAEPRLSVRPVIPADEAFCRQLSDATLRVSFAPMELPAPMLATLLAQQFRAQQIGYQQNFPDAEYFIIESDGEGVGRVVIVLEPCEEGAVAQSGPGQSVAADHVLPGRALRVVDIAIMPEARGRGIGTQVIAALEAAARASGAERLTLSVQGTNASARRLYQRLGFVDLGGEGHRQMAKPLG